MHDLMFYSKPRIRRDKHQGPLNETHVYERGFRSYTKPEGALMQKRKSLIWTKAFGKEIIEINTFI